MMSLVKQRKSTYMNMPMKNTYLLCPVCLIHLLWRRLLDNFTLRFQWFIWKNESTEKWKEKKRGTAYAGIEGLHEFRAKEFSSQTFGHGPKFRWHLGPDRNYCMTFGPGPTFLPLASLKSVIAWKVLTALSSESTIHKNRAINEMYSNTQKIFFWNVVVIAVCLTIDCSRSVVACFEL
jgi:hypothetical protein